MAHSGHYSHRVLARESDEQNPDHHHNDFFDLRQLRNYCPSSRCLRFLPRNPLQALGAHQENNQCGAKRNVGPVRLVQHPDASRDLPKRSRLMWEVSIAKEVLQLRHDDQHSSTRDEATESWLGQKSNGRSQIKDAH